MKTIKVKAINDTTKLMESEVKYLLTHDFEDFEELGECLDDFTSATNTSFEVKDNAFLWSCEGSKKQRYHEITLMIEVEGEQEND